jgi:hypothetical protein
MPQKLKKKICSKCREEKLLMEFFKDKLQKSGYYPSCKDCYRERLGIKKCKPKWSKDAEGYRAFNKKRLHRVLMEKYLGKKLLTDEVVHHINGNKLDNRLDNLKVMSKSEHHKLHWKQMLKINSKLIIKMYPIPKKIRNEMSEDKNYKKCSVSLLKDCSGKIEWHHQFTYAGKQIQEKWAIISLCLHHHNLAKTPEIRKRLAWIGLNRLFSLNKIELEEQEKKYSKVFKEWKRQVLFLNKIYGRY